MIDLRWLEREKIVSGGDGPKHDHKAFRIELVLQWRQETDLIWDDWQDVPISPYAPLYRP